MIFVFEFIFVVGIHTGMKMNKFCAITMRRSLVNTFWNTGIKTFSTNDELVIKSYIISLSSFIAFFAKSLQITLSTII